MTKQKSVTLNLTKQEAECLVLVFEQFASNFFVNMRDMKPCKPFLDKLSLKLKNSVKEK